MYGSFSPQRVWAAYRQLQLCSAWRVVEQPIRRRCALKTVNAQACANHKHVMQGGRRPYLGVGVEPDGAVVHWHCATVIVSVYSHHSRIILALAPPLPLLHLLHASRCDGHGLLEHMPTEALVALWCCLHNLNVWVLSLRWCCSLDTIMMPGAHAAEDTHTTSVGTLHACIAPHAHALRTKKAGAQKPAAEVVTRV